MPRKQYSAIVCILLSFSENKENVEYFSRHFFKINAYLFEDDLLVHRAQKFMTSSWNLKLIVESLTENSTGIPSRCSLENNQICFLADCFNVSRAAMEAGYWFYQTRVARIAKPQCDIHTQLPNAWSFHYQCVNVFVYASSILECIIKFPLDGQREGS